MSREYKYIFIVSWFDIIYHVVLIFFSIQFCIANLSAFVIGSALAWTSPALPYLTSENSTLTITEDQGSWVGSLLAVGAFTGALPAGFIADMFGRKLVCAALAVPFLLSWLLITYASSVVMLYIARFIVGFATGASSAIAPMYTGEIAESSVRGNICKVINRFLFLVNSYFSVALS